MNAQHEPRKGLPPPGTGTGAVMDAGAGADADGSSPLQAFNFAYLDERTKRMIRRAILKAVAIPGYQVPLGAREMPLPYG